MAQAVSGPAGFPPTIVRAVTAADELSWRRLWDGYLEFYETVLAPEVTADTWRRILDPAAPLIGRLALRSGSVAGISVSVLHEGTWDMAPVCYLEDLFVDPAARGGGVGRALIEDLIALGRSRGWARLYWQTKADNAAARRLYDSFASADGYVRYRMALGGGGVRATPALS